MSETKQLPVRLLGKEYVVACPADEADELMESARLLDRKMREIRETGKIVGSERIAVMAALNMAHALVRSQAAPPVNENVNARLRAMQEKIEAFLSQEERQLHI